MRDKKYKQLYLNIFRNSFLYDAKRNNIKSVLDSINKNTNKEITETYKEFSNIILTPRHRSNMSIDILRKEYIQKLKDQGYDGMLDTNDTGIFAESPIYIFNAKKHLSDDISIKDINLKNEAKELKELKKTWI